MRKGKRLFVSLFSLVLLCSCQSDIEEPKSEGSKVMDTVKDTVNEKSFLSASIREEKTRVLDLEVADTEKTEKVKREINTQLKNQGIQPYTINVTEKNMDIVKIENRWDKIFGYIFDDVFIKNEYKGFGIQQMNFEAKQPYILAIHTKINNSDPEAKEFGRKVEKEIDDLLKTKKVNKWVGNDSYTIEIYSENKQKID
ncbi:DUF4030 domain-containing protein [Bacillus cereus]|uniref:DUF4030 domain-containing protein n=1 Tax=Bacillus cereus TaxID=1396 RepID=UPI00187943E5|nr:DUF4030 domain-containing protein [Bacillus cereus]MBE7107035.1 DUF4030 domain-containing protein [Bacillus cereus]MBE7124061.1 DUF4030 domain-containing protein [Bacillus cereus]